MTDFRVGLGFDSHRTGEGRPLILAGVRIDSPFGLVGHSDADIVLHALTDAILGAVGRGDIGELYPNTDPANKDRDSRDFIDGALAAADDAGGWKVVNTDVTIFAERPHLGKWKPAMQASIAEMLGIEQDRVNVKAKTGEGVDAVGRGEAMSCQVVVLMSRDNDF